MSQITLRKLPPEIEKVLRAKAKKAKTSLNKLIIGLLEEQLSPPSRTRRNVSALAGIWNEEDLREFQRDTEQFGEIDPEVWG